MSLTVIGSSYWKRIKERGQGKGTYLTSNKIHALGTSRSILHLTLSGPMFTLFYWPVSTFGIPKVFDGKFMAVKNLWQRLSFLNYVLCERVFPFSFLEMFCPIIYFSVPSSSPAVSNYTFSDLSGKLQDFTFHVIFFSLLENPSLFTFPIYRVSWSPFGLHLCLSYSSNVRHTSYINYFWFPLAMQQPSDIALPKTGLGRINSRRYFSENQASGKHWYVWICFIAQDAKQVGIPWTDSSYIAQWRPKISALKSPFIFRAMPQ